MFTLGDILKIQSHKSNYSEMHSYIISVLKKIPGVKFSHDKVGNLYASKGTDYFYPTFACRTDSGQDIKEEYKVSRHGKSQVWMAYRTKPDGDVEQIGIGGDAKCGIYICLKLLMRLKSVKCVFFAKSEDKFAGAQGVDLKFFSDSRWLIELDRPGKHDIVIGTGNQEMCDTAFKEGLSYLGKKFNRSLVLNGSMVEAFWLKKEKKLPISVANISCGFFNPRKNKEVVVGKYLNSTLEFCERVATKMKSPSFHTSIILLPGGVKEIVEDRPKIKKSQYCATTICSSLLSKNEDYIFCKKCREKSSFLGTGGQCSKCRKPIFREIEIIRGMCLECTPPVKFYM
jgi:tripeptide aminopeptidase